VADVGRVGSGGTARARRGTEPESRDDGDPGYLATVRGSGSSVKPSGHRLILPWLENIDSSTYVWELWSAISLRKFEKTQLDYKNQPTWTFAILA
jgi:hypothetical protein